MNYTQISIVGRVYPNPKTWSKPKVVSQTDKTQTVIRLKTLKSKICYFLYVLVNFKSKSSSVHPLKHGQILWHWFVNTVCANTIHLLLSECVERSQSNYLFKMAFPNWQFTLFLKVFQGLKKWPQQDNFDKILFRLMGQPTWPINPK